MRLQVVMSDDEYDEIRETARRNRTTVSEWVRRALRQYRPEPEPGVVREARADYAATPPEAPPVPRRVLMEVAIDPVLLERVMDRYHVSTPRLAVDYALRKASANPMTKEQILAMQGVGWEGDLEDMRSADTTELL
jgi:Arc/MetJ family transcription regulator